MDVEKIRSLRNAEPFRPFMLLLDDGRQFIVEAPHYIGISPRRDLVLAVSRDGTAWFAPEQVTEAKMLRTVAG